MESVTTEATPTDEETALRTESDPAADPKTGNDVIEPWPSPFRRSRRAVRELADALRHDIGLTCRRGTSRFLTAVKTLKKRISNVDVPEARAKFMAASRSVASRSSKVFSGAGRGALAAWPRLRSWKGLFALGSLSFALLMTGILIWALKDVPWREIADGSLKPTILLETADGQPLVRQGSFQGRYARYEEFPPHLIDAVLSIEDRRFPDHYGIDLRGISRAMLRNLQAGEIVEGGSTITQQLIKVLYLESDRTLKRKIQELVIAFWLEWKLGKREILTRYLNSVYLGAGATGMPAAARIYFDKDIGALDIREVGNARRPSAGAEPAEPDRQFRGRSTANRNRARRYGCKRQAQGERGGDCESRIR